MSWVIGLALLVGMVRVYFHVGRLLLNAAHPHGMLVRAMAFGTVIALAATFTVVAAVCWYTPGLTPFLVIGLFGLGMTIADLVFAI